MANEGEKLSTISSELNCIYHENEVSPSTHLVHAVSVRERADVLQLSSGWQFITDFIHYEMCKVLHALWRSSHADELQTMRK